MPSPLQVALHDDPDEDPGPAMTCIGSGAPEVSRISRVSGIIETGMKRGTITEVKIRFSRLEALPLDAEHLGVPVLEVPPGRCTYRAFRKERGRFELWCFGKAKNLNTRPRGYKYSGLWIAFSYAFPPKDLSAMIYPLALEYYRGPRGWDRSKRRIGLSPKEAAEKDAYQGAYSRLEYLLIRSWHDIHGCHLPGNPAGATGHHSYKDYLRPLRAQWKGNLVTISRI
jgi:hypothetical protein